MVKFRAKRDPQSIGIDEYCYSLLAKECRIEMPETRLFEDKYFGVERFDRMPNGKLHVVSIAGLIGADYRLLDDMNWKIDAYASYALNPVWGDHLSFLDEDYTTYTWGVGVRAGYVTDMWTVAGHVEFNYWNSESFNWGDDGFHSLIAGIDGFLSLDSNWALMIGAEYTGWLDDEFDNAGSWTGKFGVNYNFSPDTFVGAYISGEMDHSTGDWEVVDGMGFGVKFGTQF